MKLTFRRVGDPTDTDSAEAEQAEPAAMSLSEVTTEVIDDAAVASDGLQEKPHGHSRWARAAVFGLLPALALLLAGVAGFLKWQDGSDQDVAAARSESVRAATDATIALLSYKPDTVEKDLDIARGRLTGQFLDAYTSLTHDVVIPGAKQKQISAQATVPAASSISAGANRAEVLLFVNQTVVIGQDAPTNTASSVRVTLNKVGGRWLISQFDPV